MSGEGATPSAPRATGTVPLAVFGQLTIDELVSPDGGTGHVEPAGDAPHAAVGAAVWERPVGMVARAGTDLDLGRLAYLRSHGIDLLGVSASRSPSIRYRVIYAADGERRFDELSPPSAFHVTAPEASDLPTAWGSARGYHVAAMPLSAAEAIITGLARVRPDALLTLDTHEDEVAGRQASLRGLFPYLSAFLPSREEVRSWFGYDDPPRAIDELVSLGADVVVIKMGADGVLVRDSSAAASWHIPAVPGPVVDPTGAGDAFCGGFLAGLVLGDEPSVAARRGVVSASYTVATNSVPKAPPSADEATARLDATHAERIAGD